jgi:hypothetical protein
MLQDDTCFFLAAGFDKDAWREDAAAFVEICRGMNLPCNWNARVRDAARICGYSSRRPCPLRSRASSFTDSYGHDGAQAGHRP